MAMALAVASAIPSVWKEPKHQLNGATLLFGILALCWFVGRAIFSPLQNAGRDDLLLMGGVVGAFISIRAIMGHKLAEQFLSWGIALLLLASLVVIAIQLNHPTYRPIFVEPTRALGASGFFNHYNYGANFVIATSMIVLGFALYGPHAKLSKILLGLIGVAGVMSVYYTNSRGGLLGIVVAGAVFAITLIIIGKKRKAPWFSFAAIGFPILALMLAIGLFIGWQHISEARTANGVAGNVFDNNARLYFLGIALSCIGLHPFAGGGSNSFSYEVYRFADGKAHGDIITTNPSFVHNEWMQSFTDYGLIGALLLTIFLGAIVLTAIYRTLFENRSNKMNASDAFRLGGMAALIGILAHSCFSFVFHLIPGAILLGLSLAMLTRNTNASSTHLKGATKTTTISAATICLIFLMIMGWQGTRATHAAWDAYLSKRSAYTTPEKKAKLYESAILHWSDDSLYERLAQSWLVYAATDDRSNYRELAEYALTAYGQASELNPFNPSPPLNQAIIHSRLGQDEKAAESFEQAIEIQHGMEPAFRSHYHYSMHLMRKGLGHLQDNELDLAESNLKLAKDHIDSFVQEMHWVVWEDQQKVIAVYINYGIALETNEKFDQALEQYNFVSDMEYIQTGHYEAGRALEKRGMQLWQKRNPEKAYADFISAHFRLRKAGNTLPRNITLEQRQKDLARLENAMKLMKDAGIIPEE